MYAFSKLPYDRLGQVTQKPFGDLPTHVVNDKGTLSPTSSAIGWCP